jgi:signal transduction histidine kinase/ActR/RegA family two-component response regulator
MKDFPPDYQVSTTSPGLREMKLNLLTLSFSRDFRVLESAFLEDYHHKFLKHIRYSVTFGILFYGLFGLLDAQLVPARKTALWLIRYGIVCPSLVCFLLLSFWTGFKKYIQPGLAATIVLGGLGIIAMIIIAPPPVNFSYYAGLILVFMFGYTFIRLRFVWATAVGWTIVACYEIAAVWINPTPFTVLLNNNFFFISANIIGMLACYAIEYFARKDFFLARLLENEQQKVRAANRELERRVADRTAELMRANEELREEINAHKRLETEKERLQHQLQQAQKMEAIGTLAGGIAHDFNNILSGILGYTEIALLELAPDHAISDNLKQVLKAGNRAKELVHQILTFSRQSSQSSHSIRIQPIVQETLGLLRASLSKNIEIESTIESDLYTISADPTQIYQVFMNLCTNAAHAMEKQGGLLRIDLKNVALGPDDLGPYPELKPGAYVMLTVEDNGHGIDPSIRDRIFDPYFTTKAAGKGTGMGLSVVHGIVKSHGGTIALISTPGQGATFKVLFPRLDRETISPATEEQPLPKGEGHILFVDDEAFLVDLAQQMLERLGYEVTACCDPVGALTVFRENPKAFDLVITDLAMPKMSGEQLVRELLALRPEIPIILCTGFGPYMTREKMLQIGVKEFLKKPLVIRDLAEAIARVLKSEEGRMTNGE